MAHSRRVFLTQASAAASLALLTQLPGRRLWAMSPAELLPEPDEALLRELALTAMEAARGAGATFADVRLAVARSVSVGGRFRRGEDEAPRSIGGYWLRPEDGEAPRMGWPELTLTVGYGIRAIVDGAWGFASGGVLTADAVAETARTAVAGARMNRPRRPRALELAPTPRIANGVWATPMERDPLTVPLGEQGDLALAALAEIVSQRAIIEARLNFQWRRPTTVFASTDGTVILQRLATALPEGNIRARAGEDIWSEAWDEVASLRRGGYGYEALGAATLASEVREAAGRAIARAQAARTSTPVEVGRYDLVLGPEAVGNLLAEVAGAVDLERALGYAANEAGTSFAAPPADVLGRYQVGAKLVTVRADRSQPHGAATVGWDEEGVKPEDYTFIQDGVIVDYHTNRQTALELAPWYRAQGTPMRAHGCARRTGTARPDILLPNLTLAPGPGTTTVDDLIADTKRGFYIERAGGGTDQQVLNTQYRAGHTAVRRITNGKLGSYVRDFAFQFITPQLWQSVDGLGGAGSAESRAVVTDSLALGDPLQPFPASTLRTVPLRVRQVNVLNIGRTA